VALSGVRSSVVRTTRLTVFIGNLARGAAAGQFRQTKQRALI
jgi:hypothetical protein